MKKASEYPVKCGCKTCNCNTPTMSTMQRCTMCARGDHYGTPVKPAR